MSRNSGNEEWAFCMIVTKATSKARTARLHDHHVQNRPTLGIRNQLLTYRNFRNIELRICFIASRSFFAVDFDLACVIRHRSRRESGQEASRNMVIALSPTPTFNAIANMTRTDLPKLTATRPADYLIDVGQTAHVHILLRNPRQARQSNERKGSRHLEAV